MATMKQAVITSPTSFEVRTVPRPTLQSPDEVILRTATSGICSGDLMEWYLAKKVGTVLGHEIVGYADEVGGDVTHIEEGQLVFVHHHAPAWHVDTACFATSFSARHGERLSSILVEWRNTFACRPRTVCTIRSTSPT